MKTFFKRVIYSLIISFTFLTFVSNSLTKELQELSKLHYENSYLSDAAIMCMQLYLVNPSQINKNTCLLIENSIEKNNKELNNLKLASIYLNYMQKN